MIINFIIATICSKVEIQVTTSKNSSLNDKFEISSYVYDILNLL